MTGHTGTRYTIPRCILLGLFALFFLFSFGKVALNENWFNTDASVILDNSSLEMADSNLAYIAPVYIFGDLTTGMFPALKVYEDGKLLGISVDWYGDLIESGRGRIFHYDSMVVFSASDNTDPRSNGRSYRISYNPYAWLNLDWITLFFLAGVGLICCRWGGQSGTVVSQSPGVWLGVFIFDRFATIASSPNFALGLVPDSASYMFLASDGHTFTTALSAFRTLGYPLFYLVTPEAIIPYIQLGLFCLSVFVLFLGLKRIGGNPWIALCACLPLMMIHGTYRLDILAYTNLLIPDALAVSLGILALGLCLMFLGCQRKRFIFIFLCAFVTFVAYQTKPSYLFLVVCIPMVVLGWIALCSSHRWKKELRTTLLPLTILMLVPLLLFSSLRLVMVDHFGVVSAGGRQLIGLAGNFLYPSVLTEVSDDMRPFAQQVYEIVKEKGALSSKSLEGKNLYDHIFRQYDNIIYGNGALFKLCPGTVECNEKMGALAKEVLLIRPGIYAEWLYEAAKDSFARVVDLGRWELLLPALVAMSLLFFVVSLLRARGVVDVRSKLAGTLWSCDLKMIFWTFACLSVTSLTVIILVAIPYSRYLLPTRIMFIPLCLYVAARLVAGGFGVTKGLSDKK